jgi:hypothetical protein
VSIALKRSRQVMSGRVVYAVPDVHAPTGGVRVIYRHVEMLIKAGYDAAIWYSETNTGLGWFSSNAPVLTGTSLKINEDDALVIPEPLVFAGHDPAPGCRKIIYNQNHFYTFFNVSWDEYPAWMPRPMIWLSSQASVEVLGRLRTVLPIKGIEYIPLAIDTSLFRPSEERERKIAWMPRKRPCEATLLHALFAADSRLGDVVFMPIEGLSEQETAAELSTTSVFIALGREEGFGLPVAEALAAGCAVVGYPAGGGAELFKAPGTYAVRDSDVLAMVDRTAAVLANEPTVEERATYRAWVEKTYPASTQLSCLIRALESARRCPASAGIAIHPSENGGARVPDGRRRALTSRE